jgi:hypothetical protein
MHRETWHPQISAEAERSGSAHLVFGARVGFTLQQQPRAVHMTVACGVVKRRVAILSAPQCGGGRAAASARRSRRGRAQQATGRMERRRGSRVVQRT